MAKRYHTTIISDSGQTFTLEIHDSAHSGSSTECSIAHPAISWERGEGGRFQAIIPSTFEFTFYVTGSADEQFLDDIANSDEGRFTVKLLRGSKLSWAGVILPDVGDERDDYYPQPVQLTAVDGLARLQGIEYNNAGSPYTGRDTLLTIALRCLTATGATDHWGATDAFLRLIIDWWEDNRPSASNISIWQYTRADNRRFYDIDRDGNYTYWTLWQVIEALCKTFGARCYMSEGVFRIEQVNTRTGTSYVPQNFAKDGTWISAGESYSDINIDQTSHFRSQVTFGRIPALREVRVSYLPKGDANLIAGQSWSSAGGSLFSVGTVDADTNDTLLFSGRLFVRLKYKGVSGALVPYRLQWRLTLQHGSQYWSRDVIVTQFVVTHGPAAWSTTDQYYDVSTGFIYPQMLNEELSQAIDLNFATAPLGSSDVVQFHCELVGAFDKDGNGLNTVTEVEVLEWELQEPRLNLLVDGNPLNVIEKRVYKAINYSNHANSVVDEVTVPLGDGPNVAAFGRLQVQDSTSGTWVDSDAWQVDSTGAFKSIGRLLAEERLRGQYQARRRMLGTVISSSVRAHSTLYYSYNSDTLRFLMQQVEWRVDMDEWRGEWFVVNISAGAINNDDDDIPAPPPIGPVDGQFNLPPTDGVATAPVAVAQTAEHLTAGTAITTINLSGSLDANVITAGNVVRLVHPGTGQYVEATVASTPSAGATSVSVNSVTPTFDIPAGAYVALAPDTVAVQSNTGAGFTSLFNYDPTLGVWLQVDDVELRTDPDAGDGSTAGVVFDSDGLRAYDASSTTPRIELKAADGEVRVRRATLLDEGLPATDGELCRDGGVIKFHDGTAVQVLATQGYTDTQVSNLESNLQAQITSNDNDIAALQSDVSTLQSDVSTLQSDVSTLQTDLAVAEDLFVQVQVVDITTALTAGAKWFDVVDAQLAGYTIKSFTAAVATPSIDETWDIIVENISTGASLTATIGPLATYQNVVSGTGISLSAGNYLQIRLQRTSAAGSPPQGLTCKIIYDKN